MIALFAALLGALLAGAAQLVLRILDRRARRTSLRIALISEISTLCSFIRVQQYAENYAAAAAAVARGERADMMPIDATQDYFTIYNGVVADIGLLPAMQVDVIVRFYTIAKIALDTARPDGKFKIASERNLLFMRGLAERLLQLGDQIAGFDPRSSSQGLLA